MAVTESDCPSQVLLSYILRSRPGDTERVLFSLWSAALPPPYSINHSESPYWLLIDPNTPKDWKILRKGKRKVIPLYTKIASPLSL